MRIVIAGGGLAAQRAAETLRRRGHDGPLTMVCAEPHLPYDRPPLSKELLAGERDAADISFRDESWYAEHDVDLRLGVRAVGLDGRARKLMTNIGAVPYDRLLIATGAQARTLPMLRGFTNVHVLRDADDALRLRSVLAPAARLVVIGAGFIGLEVASTARRLGAEVVVLEAAPTPLATVVGMRIGSWFARLHRRSGAHVICGTSVTGVRGDDRVTAVELADGRRFPADAVLVAVGAAPDTSWLSGAGLPADGIPTGPLGLSVVPAVFAAGDVARPLDPVTGVLRRQEHWEAAARGGADAARAMLGLAALPAPPSGFWSDQHGVRIQLVGDPAGADGHRIDGDLDAGDFSVTWHRHGQPAAVLLAGRPHQLSEARRLVAGQPEPERNAA